MWRTHRRNNPLAMVALTTSTFRHVCEQNGRSICGSSCPPALRRGRIFGGLTSQRCTAPSAERICRSHGALSRTCPLTLHPRKCSNLRWKRGETSRSISPFGENLPTCLRLAPDVERQREHSPRMTANLHPRSNTCGSEALASSPAPKSEHPVPAVLGAQDGPCVERRIRTNRAGQLERYSK